MPLITSARNPKLVALRKLTHKKHRLKQNRFVVEGLQLVGMALEAGHRPLEIFYSEAHFASPAAQTLLQRLIAAGGTAHTLAPKLMESLSERDAPQGLIVTFPLFQANLADVLGNNQKPALLIVLDRLQDPGNLGTIIRTADAVSATGVILLEPCVDPFDPKTVRGTMGSIFNIPLVRVNEVAVCLQSLVEADYILAGADGYQGQLPWQNNVMSASMALVLGNEARGLSEDLRPHLRQWLRLPLLGQAESLNVAIAGGVLMYQWVQHNFPSGQNTG